VMKSASMLRPDRSSKTAGSGAGAEFGKLLARRSQGTLACLHNLIPGSGPDATVMNSATSSAAFAGQR
jgi:hypothetical protein